MSQRQRQEGEDTLLLLEHDPVFTLGRNARKENMLFPEEWLRSRGFEVFESGRGGDVTYHGPGQIVGYPIVALAGRRRDVHRYVRDLEQVMILTCADYGIEATRINGLTGVWVGREKIGAIGVRIARWVTSHGFALNVNNSLEPFRLIVPCGIPDKSVTSLLKLLGRDEPLDAVMDRIEAHFAAVFAVETLPQEMPRSGRAHEVSATTGQPALAEEGVLTRVPAQLSLSVSPRCDQPAGVRRR